jgi:hypothetical protein
VEEIGFILVMGKKISKAKKEENDEQVGDSP